MKCKICGSDDVYCQYQLLCKKCYARVRYRRMNNIPDDAPKKRCGKTPTMSDQSGEIVKMLNSERYSQTEIAEKFGISKQRVWEIKKKIPKSRNFMI